MATHMLAVQVGDWAAGPRAVVVPRPPEPGDGSGAVQIRVLAAGLHQVVRSIASGKHPMSGSLPHPVGIDGTGTSLASGKPVYFTTLGGGAFSEYINVPGSNVYELPEGVDPVQAAALINPVMSSWMALKGRVDLVSQGRTGWTCLIMGVTSLSGRLAVRVARQMGAGRVIGVGRNEPILKEIEGLDTVITLADDPASTDFAPAAEADVVLDYLYGPYPDLFLRNTASNLSPVTYITIGSLVGPKAEISSELLRMRDVTLRGAGPGSWSLKDMAAETPGMLAVLKGVKEAGVVTFGLKDIVAGWKPDVKGRVVFAMEEAGEAS